MKKVIVIGCPGSGKSTFSKALHKITNLPLFHLDMIYWNADETTVEKTVFLGRLSEIMKKDQWIIDGNYASTMELRMHACDTVIFLDYPVDICLNGIKERKEKARSDLPWIEPNEDDAEFIEFIKSYHSKSKPQVMDLLKHHSDKNIYIFSTRTQAEKFLSEIQQRI